MEILFIIVILVMSVVIHEVAHGYAAYVQGDLTAAVQGRLTLNPISHIDLFGSIIIPGALMLSGAPFLIGWAKPVPFNPYNLRDQRWGPMWVALAGPASNILIASIFTIAIRLSFVPVESLGLVGYVVLINLVLAIFNLIPVPPLDGSKVLFALLPQRYVRTYQALEQYGLILALLFIFVLWKPFTIVVLTIFALMIGPESFLILDMIQGLFM